MESYYLVSEIVDEDGGFGDAVQTTVPLAVFATYKQAQAYVDKYSNETEYDDPYMPLCFGELTITSVISEPTVPAKELPNYDDRSNWKE